MRKEKVIENKYKCTDVWLKIRVRGMRVCACICIPCRCKERNVQDLKKRTEIQLPIFFSKWKENNNNNNDDDDNNNNNYTNYTYITYLFMYVHW